MRNRTIEIISGTYKVIMTYNLGKMKRITDLRSVWPHEALDFTKWLADEQNLAILSESVGIDITLEERESSVGSFNVDLFATENGTGRKIIVENQLEDTNHDHLGKIITYASGKGAQVVIWIVKRARDEHRQAIEWLNQHTDSEIGFFLVEIELWQIDDSSLAPKFNVVEKPNDWAKTMKAVEGMSETEKLKLEYWQAFVEKMRNNEEYSKNFSIRKALPQHWYSMSLGHSTYHLSLSINTQKKSIATEIYFDDDKQSYEKFKMSASVLQSAFETDLEWIEAKQDCRIVLRKSLNVKDRSKWNEAFDWYLKEGIAFKRIANKIDC